MKTYREIILEEIDRIKKLHDINDPYWQRVINGLVNDLKSYEATQHWRITGETEFDRIWRKILHDFFGEDIL